MDVQNKLNSKFRALYYFFYKLLIYSNNLKYLVCSHTWSLLNILSSMIFVLFTQGALNFFTSSMNTLCNKTIDDTLLTVKHYEAARYSSGHVVCDNLKVFLLIFLVGD